MQSNFMRHFNAMGYKSQVIALVCGLGAARITAELFLDFTTQARISELLLDMLIAVLIGVAFYSSWKKEFITIHSSFGILLTILLGATFLHFGGIEGYSKFNYFASVFFIIMAYENRNLYALLTFNLLVLLGVLIVINLNPSWLQHVNAGSSFKTADFWFSIIILSCFTIYLKELTLSQGNKLSALNLTMANQIRESRNLSQKLEQHNNTLTVAQTHLEAEVNRRTETLQKKNKSVESFIQLNTTELIEGVEDLLSSIQAIKSSSSYSDKLRSSSDELAQVVTTLRNSLLENTLVNRNEIRKHERIN